MNVALRPPHRFNTIALCAGVGGLDLGLALAVPAARTLCYVEREIAAAASLAASIEAGWFHPAAIWSDMRTFDAGQFRGLVDCVTSGDPCQGNSVAGKRLGQLDDRWLLDRAIDIFAASGAEYFFRENVPGNADGQLAVAIPALEGLGCRVASGIFSSAETGNTMRRERLFILAVREGGPGRVRGAKGWLADADAGGSGCELGSPTSPRSLPGTQPGLRGILPPAAIPGPTDSRWIDVLDRFPELQPALSQAEAESHLRRGIDALAHRIERLRATGNGVDPVAAAYAFLSLGARLGLWARA